MKTIIISDTHLTTWVHPAKLAFLKSIIEPADRVIIAGDFWDSYLISFEQFVESGWRELFPLLKQRQTVYLYGNHDPKSAADSRVSLFSVEQGDQYRLKVGSRTLLIEHGHRIHPHIDGWAPRWMVNRFTTMATLLLQASLFRIFGPERTLRALNTKDNVAMRAWAVANLKSNEILVTGHNDYAEIDLEHQFICTGLIRYGFATYLQIDKDQFEIVRTTY